MHILMTVNAAWNISNFRRPLVAAFVADGHCVTVLAPPDDSVADIEAAGCRFVPLAMNAKGLNPFRDPMLARRLKNVIRTEQPDAVLGYTIKNNIFGAIAARRAGVPFIPNVTGLGTAFLSGGTLQRVAEMLYRYAFRDLPVVFFQNEDDLALFLDRKLVRESQARLLPGSGIDLAHFSAGPFSERADGPVFLMIARLLHDKGVVEYVEAARLLKSTMPRARFQLLGPPGAENRTAIDLKTVEAWGAEGAIEYLGETDDVRPFIAEADCVVLPSYREGAPRTLIEAAAMARPTIATDVPGCRAVVEDGVTGFLCAARSGESLAAACQRFVALPIGQREIMGLAGRRKMEREFDQEIVVAAYRKALQDVLEGG
ncbi:MAG: glycosyltransferase family 4 protein [Parvibaculum sp.]|uniref:glycosyltransferase family 4 protein n=1 Tax=Parvibaculum sp. TaxID=2024848 RepID=UPI00272747F6|nr:glycosyltransferase family 4 protein [Parvibaculum sp.]MDO8838154.1 glycosyltransferase family 4 protein [Parvibaculum sp.]